MEKEILDMLDHPFLPTLYAKFDASHYSCLVMEFCPGSDFGLQITTDISSEGNVKKRKDLDTPLEPQLAKRHTGHDGTDVYTTIIALENNGETAFSEKATEKQQRR
ncbi:hypothetical protein FF1_023142 [Malus domestica]